MLSPIVQMFGAGGKVLGAAEPASPSTDPDLYVWYRGDSGVTVNGSNELAAAGSWLDQSGGGRHFGNGASTKIDYLSTGLNGKGYLSFTPAKHSSGNFSIGGATISMPLTAYFLIRQLDWVAGHVIMMQRDPSIGPYLSIIAQNGSSPQVNGNTGGAGVASQSGEPALNTWRILTVVFNNASSVVCVNKNSDQTGTMGTGVAHGGLAFGIDTNLNASYPTMDIAGIIISHAANDATQRLKHVNWLSWYGNLGL